MHVLENSYVLFIGGERIGKSSENFLQLKKKLPVSGTAVFLDFIAAPCPSAGCDPLEFSDGFFPGFISNYLDCPHAE